jgi:ATP:ADP antiporter, AAA family
VNLPSAIGFTILYSSLSNRFSADKVFYGILTAFLTFFTTFATVIYPNRMLLHPNAAADVLTRILPSFFVPLIAIFRSAL